MTNSAKPQTIPDLVEAGLAKNTTGVACATKRGGVWIETSVEDFRAKIRQFALGLYDLGVRKGDRVALHAENSTECKLPESRGVGELAHPCANQ